jgi:hypothetical protein
MRRAVSITALLALFALVMTAEVREALRRPLRGFDEPLWFMRSLVTPADLSTVRYRYWAKDIPGMNRWVYYVTLKLTGLDHIPAGEQPCWSIGSEFIMFQDNSVSVEPKAPAFTTLADWEAVQGRYAPRRSIMAMRMADLGAFAVCVISLWFTAWLVLRHKWLAALTVTPLVLSPIFVRDLSFFVTSGDIFLLACLAATLAAMTFFHLRGRGTSSLSILIVSILAGLASSSKHPGVLAVAAFAAYLAWQSRGLQRIVNPMGAIMVSLATFAAINPVLVFCPGEWPWNVCIDMMQRRAQVNRIQMSSYGVVTATETFKFFWWPFFPAGAYTLWASRKERWFPAVGCWAIFIIGGMLLGMITIKVSTFRYIAPLEMAVFFPVGLCIIALSRHHLTCAPQLRERTSETVDG